MDRSRVWELDEILALVLAARRPVGSFEYADTNNNLLGLVIEHVRQRPLVEVLRDGVLRVEGTERLFYQPDEAPTDPMAMPRGESRDALEQGGGYLPSLPFMLAALRSQRECLLAAHDVDQQFTAGSRRDWKQLERRPSRLARAAVLRHLAEWPAALS